MEPLARCAEIHPGFARNNFVGQFSTTVRSRSVSPKSSSLWVARSSAALCFRHVFSASTMYALTVGYPCEPPGLVDHEQLQAPAMVVAIPYSPDAGRRTAAVRTRPILSTPRSRNTGGPERQRIVGGIEDGAYGPPCIHRWRCWTAAWRVFASVGRRRCATSRAYRFATASATSRSSGRERGTATRLGRSTCTNRRQEVQVFGVGAR